MTMHSRPPAFDMPMLDACDPSRPVLCVTGTRQLKSVLEGALTAHRAVFADNAYEAIRAVHSGLHDAYLIDYWVPGWSGVQLCRHIRTDDPHVPVLMLCTAAARQGMRKRSAKAGADAFLCVPEDQAQLSASLATLLASADERSQRARIAAERAVQRELARQCEVLSSRVQATNGNGHFANERLARARAFDAFIESGGICSCFERWWPQIYATQFASFAASVEYTAFAQ